MAENMLVVTSDPAFGQSIRNSLQDSGSFRVYIVNNKAAAVVRTDELACKMAFLDLQLGEQSVEEIGQSLRTIIPAIKLFILADNETPPALDSIRPWTLVRKPYLFDLLKKTMEPTLNPTTSPTASTDALPWLSDVSKAAQHLTSISLGSSSQAALITRDSKLWAYAGQLSQAAANEISQTLAKNWSAQKGSDLLRFVRLESTKAEHMLYATELAENVLLAMVFDAETPFSTIRLQASQLVTSLSQNEVKEEKVEKPIWPKASGTKPVPTVIETVDKKNDKFDVVDVNGVELEDDDDEIVIPAISNILVDIPAPDPEPVTIHPQAEIKSDSVSDVKAAPVDSGEMQRSSFSHESSTPVALKDLILADPPTDMDQTVKSQSVKELETTIPSEVKRRPQTPVRKPMPGEMAETRPQHPSKELSGRIILEPASAGLYELTYACLLVPRFTSHYMTGDVADRLSEWLPNICIAFGWRLEHLAVRPEYIQWIVNVPPATSPGSLMRIMRQQTSDKIFGEFPRLKKENPSGDFWAPGYLIMGGTQPHPPQLVKDYIRQIRQRQGIEKSSR